MSAAASDPDVVTTSDTTSGRHYIVVSLEKFPKSSLITGNAIGQGGFGNVISGTLNGKNVAVKILHSSIGKKKFSKFQNFCKLEHRNLIKFFGIIDLDLADCQQLVFNYANKGNLLEWLRNAQGTADEKVLNKFACDIINGMEYLHNMNFIHGCLAARNVLLDNFFHKPSGNTFLNVKISDYGMYSVIDGMGGNYYKMTTSKTISIRWMPKEAIHTDESAGDVTCPSDMWSFGCVLWEIWTKGETPYGAALSNTEVKQHILNGSSPLTFMRPGKCPKDTMSVMENIFKVNQNERPTFMDLRKKFDTLNHGLNSQNQMEKSKIQNVGPVAQQGKTTKGQQKPQINKETTNVGTKGPTKLPNPNKKETFKNKGPSEGQLQQNQRKSEQKKKNPKPNIPSQNVQDIAPPPYTPPLGYPPHVQIPTQSMPDVAFASQPYHQATVPPPPYHQAGMYQTPQAGAYPTQPLGIYPPPQAGMCAPYPYGYGVPQSQGIPPPFQMNPDQERIRELEKKLNSLETQHKMKGLEQKVEKLQQQNQQKRKKNPPGKSNAQPAVRHRPPTEAKEKQSKNQGQQESSSSSKVTVMFGGAAMKVEMTTGTAAASAKTNSKKDKK